MTKKVHKNHNFPPMGIDLYKKVDVVCGENPESSELFTCFEFLKAKRSQYYGKFEVNFSIYRSNEFSYSS